MPSISHAHPLGHAGGSRIARRVVDLLLAQEILARLHLARLRHLAQKLLAHEDGLRTWGEGLFGEVLVRAVKMGGGARTSSVERLQMLLVMYRWIHFGSLPFSSARA